jgi:hypothetical protein
MTKILHLMRQAAQLDYLNAKDVLVEMEERRKLFCTHCFQNESECGQKLKMCHRCKFAWYCGKSCQKAHWTLGHKTECVEEPDGCRVC